MRRICAGMFSLMMFIGSGAWTAETETNGEWRKLPLVQEGRVHSDWVQMGWGRFVVDQGALRTECDERGIGLLLYKSEPLGNCQIRVVYKPEHARSNAGVFVRIDPGVLQRIEEQPPPVRRRADGELTPESLQELMRASEQELGPWYAVHHGYEVQICDEAEAAHRTGAIYSLAQAQPLPPAPADGWRTMTITLRDTVILVDIDGQRVTRFDSRGNLPADERDWYEPKRETRRPTVGYLGLQNHDPGDVVYFREVSVRSLPR